ncbi:uncharacterized protein CLUP02_13876 [Colletotrichum lupini]|uniref:Uncharacterized protein n=1 Tax=Colletotrichum lupini TaxID=145971 RepID=A0A9Q8T3R0_9PEZI|nr:uncharacterized protein CLUP02_13876 [Colletotrichum lupini]UQC88353.1 hypothetical protein CLUP02_13876 [Colletotrichum lupini]
MTDGQSKCGIGMLPTAWHQIATFSSVPRTLELETGRPDESRQTWKQPAQGSGSSTNCQLDGGEVANPDPPREASNSVEPVTAHRWRKIDTSKHAATLPISTDRTSGGSLEERERDSEIRPSAT